MERVSLRFHWYRSTRRRGEPSSQRGGKYEFHSISIFNNNSLNFFWSTEVLEVHDLYAVRIFGHDSAVSFGPNGRTAARGEAEPKSDCYYFLTLPIRRVYVCARAQKRLNHCIHFRSAPVFREFGGQQNLSNLTARP